MNKTIKNASLGAAIILAGTTGVANTAHANEQTTPDTAVKETFKPLHTPDKEMEQAEQNKTEAAADVAKTESELKQNTDAQKEASDRINSVKQDIEISKNAKEIVSSNEAKKADVQKELTAATEQQNNTANTATHAKNAVTNAEKDVSKAKHDVVDQEADVDSQEKIVKDMSTEGIAKSISDQENELKTAQEAVTENKTAITQAQKDVTRAENAVRDYKPQTRTTYVDPSLKEYVDNHPTNVADYKYNKDYRNPAMENVAFTGTKVVTTEITKEQYDQYRKTGKFDYVVDNQKLAESFVKLLNELRELNGVKGNIKADAEFMAYAEARANEMSKNNLMSHGTTINSELAEMENLYGTFGLRGSTRIENGKTIISMYEPTTHDSFAYKLLVGWYSDFTNVTGANYGHRRALLSPVGDKFGLAITTKPGAEGNNFTALEIQSYEPEYEYEDGEKYTKTTPEVKEFEKNYYGFNQKDTLNPTFNGKKMKFIAEHTFLFTVTEIVNDQTANLNAALEQAKSKRDALIAAKPTLENKVVVESAKLDSLKEQAKDITTAIASAKTNLENAKNKLEQLKSVHVAKLEALENATNNYENAQKAHDTATERVTTLEKQLEQLDSEIKRAQELQDKLPELQKALATEESKQANLIAEQANIEHKLVIARNHYVESVDIYNHVKSFYDLEKELNVYYGDQHTFYGVPLVTPTSDELPEFDLATLQKPVEPAKPAKPAKPAEPANTLVIKPTITLTPTKPVEVETPNTVSGQVNEKPVTTSVTQQESEVREIVRDDYFVANTQKQLPNTGSESGILASVLGMTGLLTGFALKRTKREN